MRLPRKIFAFSPAFNSPDLSDATGAFLVGLAQFQRYFESQGSAVLTCRFNNRPNVPDSAIRDEIANALRTGAAGSRFDAVVYFGHGSPRGLLSARFTGPQLDSFAGLVSETAKPSVAVLLYACSCAADGGAAFRISERLRLWVRHGLQVMGHTNAGHAFRNPSVRVFPNGGAQAGRNPAPPGRQAAWNRAMREPGGTFWMLFPFMTDKDLREKV